MLQDQDCRISVSMCQTVRGPVSVARTRPIGGLYFLAFVDGGREMETRRSLFRRVLLALYIIHPALRKGPPFLQKTPPIFHFFTKSTAPFHFLPMGLCPQPTTRKSPRNNFTHDLHYSRFSICLLLLLLLGQCFTVHAVASRDISHSISYDYRIVS